MSVPVWIALLRGVNVGGHGKLPMADFRVMLGELGYGEPQTYIQSGNAVFTSNGSAEAIATTISDAIEARFGFRRPVLVRSADAFAAALAACPFTPYDPKQVHLFFLDGAITLDEAALGNACTAGEQFAVIGDCFYLHTPNGFGTSQAAKQLERHLKADSMTARNLRSCEAILALAEG